MGSFKVAAHNDSQSIKDQQGNYSGELLRAQRSISITLTNVHHKLIILPSPLKALFLLCIPVLHTCVHRCTQMRTFILDPLEDAGLHGNIESAKVLPVF